MLKYLKLEVLPKKSSKLRTLSLLLRYIYKIINGGSKSKPRINMTIKGPLRKQVIVPMNNDNKTKFIEYSSTHVFNLNRELKNIK